MVNVFSRKCRSESCGKQLSFEVAGTKTAEYCSQHSPERMIDGNRKKCTTASCGKIPSLGVADKKNVDYGSQHAPDEMVNVCSRK